MAGDGVSFIKDGPAIPVKLLQQLEDGQITIFAGAGVSRRFGLPDFAGLVTKACARLGRAMLPDEKELFEHGSFDAALGLIERRIPKGRLRKVVSEVLTIPDDADLGTHAALLTLATSKQGCLRLVTTNFDRGFEFSPYGRKPSFDFAPYLPLPVSRWDSVVHLHGGLGNAHDPDGEGLVLTSSDFGRAYITEGWASKFLAELFRRSGAILFVGYSVSDPAIRYIVDAFAADRGDTGSHVAPAYIFIAGGSVQDERTWRSRGVEPLAYDPKDNHRLLHETLRSCANLYATGMFDRASIVFEFGTRSPLGALDRVGISQMTWALNEPSGYAARRFAKLEPPAPIAWLDVLHAEGLFRLSSNEAHLSAAVAPVQAPYLMPALHRATEALCGWLCSHLGAPELIEWVIDNGCHLHPHLAELVRRRVADGAAPRLPKGPERLWRFWSASDPAVYDRSVEHQALAQHSAIETAEWNPLLRDAVLTWFAPTLRFKRPFRFDAEDIDPEAARSYADMDLLPASEGSAQRVFASLLARADSSLILPDLVGDFGQILHRGLTYLAYFDVINSNYDGSFSVCPSIDDHPQNSDHETWEVYIRALRLAWERMADADPTRARVEVSRWMTWPFPIFRRFVLWSAGRPGGLTADEAAHFVATQPSSTMWGADTRRELLQYLRTAGRNLSPPATEQLADLIVEGPPRADISPDEFVGIRDRTIHLRLAKLEEGGCVLPARARMAWDEILTRHPTWVRETSEQDEFAMWVGGGFGPPDELMGLPSDYVEKSNEAIVTDLMANPTAPETVEQWRGLIRADIGRAKSILKELADGRLFEPGLWAAALDNLAGEESLSDAVRLYGDHGAQLGGAFILTHLQTLAGLINRYFRGRSRENEEAAWNLWDLIVGPALTGQLPEFADVAMAALNSSIGNLAEALIIKLGEIEPKDYAQVPVSFQNRLESLLSGASERHTLARVVFARALAWLYRLKSDLVVPNFLTKFDWEQSPEARNLWVGYLMRPQITPEFWPLLRPLLLRAIQRSADLGKYEDQLYSFLAFILLHVEYEIDAADARHALTIASPKGRAHVAWFWWRQSDSATDYGARLYRNRLKYLLVSVWPLEQELREESASKNLARLAMCCSSEFADAVATILPLISRVGRPLDVVWSLKDKDVVDKFPQPTLALLDAVIGEDLDPWGAPYLRGILRRLMAEPVLADDPRFRRLDGLVRLFE